jgi:hypothetical protein
MNDTAAFVRWMQENRGEDPRYLRARFERFQNMVGHVDLWEGRNKRAFLMTPREEFCRPSDRAVIYDVNYHDIGFGVTITGPRVVGRMTSSIDVKMGEKVLEIGTGSGYQSAYLSNLTDKVWTIEIIKPLAERTRGVYDALIQRGYKRIQGYQFQIRRRLLRLGGGGAVRQDHRHLRHRSHSSAAAATTQARWDHGDPGRASGGAAYPQGRQGGRGGRSDRRQALRYLQRQARALCPIHQAGRRGHQGDALARSRTQLCLDHGEERRKARLEP